MRNLWLHKKSGHEPKGKKVHVRCYRRTISRFTDNSRRNKGEKGKFDVFINMEPPRTTKEVQILNGKVVALSRFLLRSVDTWHPFFQLLKKQGPKVIWTKECKNSFKSLKEQLCKLPTLHLPKLGKKLTMYVTAFDSAISAVSDDEKHMESRHAPIYYLSRALQGPKARYSPIEKLALIVVGSLKATTILSSSHDNNPHRTPDATSTKETRHVRRLTKWAID